MDSQLAQKVSQLAKSLKASGIAPDSQEAFKMALELLKEKEQDAATNENAPDGKGNEEKVFLGKDSIGAEFKGKSLKELLEEK